MDHAAIYLHARRLRRLSARGKKTLTVAMLFHPSFYPYLRFLRPDIVAYHAYDLFSGTPGWNPSFETMEDSLLRQAHLVSAVSESIAEGLLARVPREIRILPNGVDLEAFDRAAKSGRIPADLAAIPRPRLGYVGSLHPQVDFGLIAALAEKRPEYHFVLVGGRPELRDPIAEAELEKCRARSNVHFLGEKERTLVPGYVCHMDVNLMLYRLSAKTWIHAIYPLKLHEYLAAGKPVVSVDIRAVRPFAAVVRIARGLDDWLSALDDAVSRGGTGSESERRATARGNGWDARTDTLERWLLQTVTAHAEGGSPSRIKSERS
jgi:glycosyltransferase involved in cell wall biosynthesis